MTSASTTDMTSARVGTRDPHRALRPDKYLSFTIHLRYSRGVISVISVISVNGVSGSEIIWYTSTSRIVI
jgi:hypothetical protein